MREILFRGKRSEDGMWACGSLFIENGLINNGKCYILTSPMGGCGGKAPSYFNEIDPETIGEYTWLNDKNGTRIFEGDIVEAYGRQMQIVMDRAMWKMKTLQGNLSWAWVNADKSEVIGNIYDNPELLEGDGDE